MITNNKFNRRDEEVNIHTMLAPNYSYLYTTKMKFNTVPETPGVTWQLGFSDIKKFTGKLKAKTTFIFVIHYKGIMSDKTFQVIYVGYDGSQPQSLQHIKQKEIDSIEKILPEEFKPVQLPETHLSIIKDFICGLY